MEAASAVSSSVWLVIPKLMLLSATSLLVYSNLAKSLVTQDLTKCSHLAPYLPSLFPAAIVHQLQRIQNNWRKNDSKENKECVVKRIKANLDSIIVSSVTKILYKSYDVTSWVTWVTGDSRSGSSSGCLKGRERLTFMLDFYALRYLQPPRNPQPALLRFCLWLFFCL